MPDVTPQNDAVPYRQAFVVAGVNPLWRYAVAMAERADLPAVPFTTRAAALAFVDQSRQAFPDRTTLLLRRRLWRRVEVVDA